MKKLLIVLILAAVLIPVIWLALKNNDTTTTGNGQQIPGPAPLAYEVIKPFPHDTSSYTQGLIIYKGSLYEGTGLEGKSKLMKVDLATGKVVQSKRLDSAYFGEGITILNDTIYQLTWRNRKVFMYSLKDFNLLKEFPLDTEGWGITTDGKELIVSNGSSNLDFYEPGSFKKIRTVNVTEAGNLVSNVNELEYIDGFVYANQYQTDYILKIDPVTGIVTAKADFKQLGDKVRSENPFVDYFNGIAYDAETKKIYVTGKLWPQLYEIQFITAAPVTSK